jgi:hypothetical protein
MSWLVNASIGVPMVLLTTQLALGDVPPLRVDALAVAAGSVVHDDVMSVRATITNTSNRIVTTTVWSIYGWSWTTDNPCAWVEGDALKNSSSLIELKPRQHLSGDVQLYVAPCIATGIKTIRIGFVADASIPVTDNLGFYRGHSIVWSGLISIP